MVQFATSQALFSKVADAKSAIMSAYKKNKTKLRGP
jgi:hypothetical protein